MRVVSKLSALAAGTLLVSCFCRPAFAGETEQARVAPRSWTTNDCRGRRVVRRSSTLTVTGRLIKDADDNNLHIRDARGREWHVEYSRVADAEAFNKLVTGDTIRAYGPWRDNMIVATNIRNLGVGYRAVGRRVYYAPYYYRLGDRTTVTGTLVSDADDDEFEIRSRSGRTYMIRTRTIPDFRGLNGLHEGDRVRVYGYWFVADNRPQLEAENARVLRRR